jgi:hypothetical protein
MVLLDLLSQHLVFREVHRAGPYRSPHADRRAAVMVMKSASEHLRSETDRDSFAKDMRQWLADIVSVQHRTSAASRNRFQCSAEKLLACATRIVDPD